MCNARAVINKITSIQQESNYLEAHCITILNYIERPVVKHVGTKHLVGKDSAKAEK